MNNVSFSIIVPTYNSEDKIQHLIDIVSDIDYDDYEVIIVNDGSTDSTGSIIKKNVSKNRKIKIVNKENGGVSSARNIGISKAKNDYLLFLDDDDAIMPQALNILSKQIVVNNRPDYIRFSGLRENSYRKSEKIRNFTNSKPIDRQIITQNNKVDCYVWLLAIKNGIKIAPFNEKVKYLEDDLFYLDNIAGKEKQIALIDDVLYVYKYNESSKTKDARRLFENYADLITAGNEIQKSAFVKSRYKKDITRGIIINMIYWRFSSAKRNMTKTESRQSARKALKILGKNRYIIMPFFSPKPFIRVIKLFIEAVR